eukprot:TRINITY_DN22695_c0_g1_i5.p1 TRINITY_DN22695_c0_g1~~TRINITY_DN22695_c0_g1_i5.p1  ORF type:complete len:200 (-),score=18.50 TRINITY_DN22695_c0_g1_i5:275-832(-)
MGPNWYPPAKYTHEGKDVISFLVRSDVRGVSARHRHGQFDVTVYYTDGSSCSITERRGSPRPRPKRLPRPGDAEPVPNPVPAPEPAWVPLGGGFEDILIREWAFNKYITSSFGYEDIEMYTYVAVPPEDPDEWVEIEPDDEEEMMYEGSRWVRKQDLPEKGKVEKHETSSSYEDYSSRRRRYGGR